jgi:hypothetical protein
MTDKPREAKDTTELEMDGVFEAGKREGRREVVEWVNTHSTHMSGIPEEECDWLEMDFPQWEIFLKEKGLEK